VRLLTIRLDRASVKPNMIDRDPITEPAGELIAARMLLDVLLWIDDGTPERFAELSESLLTWKGRRLRDAISQTAAHRLADRVAALTPETPDTTLDRIGRAAALCLDGPELAAFTHATLALAPHDSDFRMRRLRALDGLVRILPQRKDRDILEAARLLLQHRALLAVDALGSDNVPVYLKADFALAEHLYQHFGRNDPVAAELRKWFVANAEHVLPNKLRVMRTAALLDHLDVLEACFDAGTPSQPEPHSGHTGDTARKLVVDRLAELHPEALKRITGRILQHLAQHTGDADALALWALDIARRARQRGLGDGAWAALGLLADERTTLVDADLLHSLKRELLHIIDEARG